MSISDHPVQLVLSDDLQRSRLTVFFRLLLAIPHFIWLALWLLAALLATIANWLVVLFAGRAAASLHNPRHHRARRRVAGLWANAADDPVEHLAGRTLLAR